MFIQAQGEENMDEQKLVEILVGIGILGEKVDATNNHLATLNGSVKTLYGKAEDNKSAIAIVTQKLLQHQIDCPGLKVINEINQKLFSGEYKGSNIDQIKTEAWEAKQDLKDFKKEWVYPIIKITTALVLSSLATLALYHSGLFLK
jgi:hypothetical protein